MVEKQRQNAGGFRVDWHLGDQKDAWQGDDYLEVVPWARRQVEWESSIDFASQRCAGHIEVLQGSSEEKPWEKY